ncbi:tyrosine-type recombinase/integrase [Curvivirga aplysinae]|uniref:tyrosine-type recombinase/integrase n=1 Tax=Curvivirga aplysinae TaxID=2529852 RepID=UPI0012BC8599|nr:tyrosine-type recombinase/integrase [Curvivirga aplysinae]MTI10506.1 hypothetical protein [Curvivirga aplysinae]
MKLTRLPNLKIWKRNERIYTQYRKKVDGKTHLVDIRGEYLSVEWYAHYNKIKESFEVKRELTVRESFGWLIEQYLGSPEFKEKRPSTQKDYRASCDILKKTKAKNKPFASMSRADVIKLRNHFSDSPSKANKIVRMLSVLGEMAIDLGLRADNPAKGVSSLKAKGGGNRAWTEGEMKAFVEGCDNPMMKIAFFVALFTGQRQGDCLNMTRTDERLKDGLIKVIQEKTGTEIYIPCHPLLMQILQEAPTNSIYFICREDGKPYSTDGFRANWNRQLAKLNLETNEKAGRIKGCTFHGLRRNAASALAEAGCSNEEIKAITGHKTDDMVRHYTQSVQQISRAKIAMQRVEEKQGVSTGGVYNLVGQNSKHKKGS